MINTKIKGHMRQVRGLKADLGGQVRVSEEGRAVCLGLTLYMRVQMFTLMPYQQKRNLTQHGVMG